MVLGPGVSKQHTTSRGLVYQYSHIPAHTPSQPTLLFLHGFPSHSSDFTPLVDHFSAKGYGILLPDLLGYGGTSKPTDPAAYRMKLMSRDVIDILDHEALSANTNVVAIGHDWGAGLCSRLANYYPDRFRAFAFLALGYFPPVPGFNIDAVNRASIEKNGYAKFGYWKDYERDGMAEVIEAHLESYFSLLYNDVEGLGQRWISPEGAQEEWLSEDRRAQKLLPAMTEGRFKERVELFAHNGFSGPLCWYKAMVRGLTPADDAEISPERTIITKPVFYAACKRNFACPPDENSAIVRMLCPDATIREFDSGHWVILEAAQPLCRGLEVWLEGLSG